MGNPLQGTFTYPGAGSNREVWIGIASETDNTAGSVHTAVTAGGWSLTTSRRVSEYVDRTTARNQATSWWRVLESEISNITDSSGSFTVSFTSNDAAPTTSDSFQIFVVTLEGANQGPIVSINGDETTSASPISATFTPGAAGNFLLALVSFDDDGDSPVVWSGVGTPTHQVSGVLSSASVAYNDNSGSTSTTITATSADGAAARAALNIIELAPAAAGGGQTDDVDVTLTITPSGDDLQGVSGVTDDTSVTITFTIAGTDRQGTSTAPAPTGNNPADQQASVRAVTATTLTYNGDWHALFDQQGIAAGTFNERLLLWINVQLSSNYTNLPDAMSAFAIDRGSVSWDALGVFNID